MDYTPTTCITQKKMHARRTRGALTPYLKLGGCAAALLNVIGQYLRRCSERGGLYWDHQMGIALGSPLSPLLGAFFLTEVDDALEQLGLFSVRYMDDILVLAPTRWKLRQAVKVVNQGLTALRLDKHPEKTFIGRIVKGFDFLGYHFSPDGLTIAKKTLDNFVVRVRQLYEQKLEEHVSTRLGAYVRRWVRWIVSGLLLSPQIRRRVLTILDLAVGQGGRPMLGDLLILLPRLASLAARRSGVARAPAASRRAPVSGDGSVPMGSDSPSRAGPQPGVEEADPVTRITLSAPLPGGGALGPPLLSRWAQRGPWGRSVRASNTLGPAAPVRRGGPSTPVASR